MVLKSVLGLRIEGIPTKLGFLVVDKLDPINMKLRIHNGDINITIQSIYAILSLPMVGFDLLRDEPPSKYLDISASFRQQFPNKPRMRPTDVMDLIIETGEVGLQFKINFLVLFVNVIRRCSTMGCCKIDFLDKICNEGMLSNIN